MRTQDSKIPRNIARYRVRHTHAHTHTHTHARTHTHTHTHTHTVSHRGSSGCFGSLFRSRSRSHAAVTSLASPHGCVVHICAFGTALASEARSEAAEPLDEADAPASAAPTEQITLAPSTAAILPPPGDFVARLAAAVAGSASAAGSGAPRASLVGALSGLVADAPNGGSDGHARRRNDLAAAPAGAAAPSSVSADGASAEIAAGVRGLHVRSELKEDTTEQFVDRDHAAKVAAKRGNVGPEGSSAPATSAEASASPGADTRASPKGLRSMCISRPAATAAHAANREAVAEASPSISADDASTEIAAGRRGLHARSELKEGTTEQNVDPDHAATAAAKRAGLSAKPGELTGPSVAAAAYALSVRLAHACMHAGGVPMSGAHACATFAWCACGRACAVQSVCVYARVSLRRVPACCMCARTCTCAGVRMLRPLCGHTHR